MYEVVVHTYLLQVRMHSKDEEHKHYVERLGRWDRQVKPWEKLVKFAKVVAGFFSWAHNENNVYRFTYSSLPNH